MRAFVLLSVMALTACATDPTGIAPTPVDYHQYMSKSCSELQVLADATQADLTRYLSSQGHARVGDALLWPLPLSRMTGKNSRNVRAIQTLQGELEAQKTARTLRCEAAASSTSGT